MSYALQIHIWMKGLDRSIYEIGVLYDFRLFELPLQALVTMISLYLTHSTTEGETAEK